MASRRQGFVGNRRNIGRILKEDPGVKAAVDGIAEDMAARAGGHVKTYTTDRHVAAVVVSAEDQAVNGAATRALGEMGGTLS